MAHRCAKHLTIQACATWHIALLVTCSLAGCNTTDSHDRLADAHDAYQRRDYGTAEYRAHLLATELHPGNPAYYEANYLVGMSAYRQGNRATAHRYLLLASRGPDRPLTGDALASIGLIEAELGRHREAERAFLAAAKRLRGQGRANAYFSAAMEQRKLGKWGQSRISFRLAKAHSRDRAFLARLEQETKVTGFTLQLGAFAEQANAERALAQLSAGRGWVLEATGPRGQTLYLVQVGRHASYAEAWAAMGRLSKDIEAIIVPITHK